MLKLTVFISLVCILIVGGGECKGSQEKTVELQTQKQVKSTPNDRAASSTNFGENQIARRSM